jgi:2-oxoglutarate ferredoxin oxidoreductase subunit alpha
MSLGQLVEDVRLAVEGRAKVFLHGRPSGGIPTGEEVLEVIKNIMKS